MIVPMKKYSLVVYHKDYQKFLSQLQELGMVDVTMSAWEPSNEEREKVALVDDYKQAVKHLREIEKTHNEKSTAEKTLSVNEALNKYRDANSEVENLRQHLKDISYEIADLTAWGDFDVAYIEKLKAGGLNLFFYKTSVREFEKQKSQWSETYALSEISNDGKDIYFVVTAPISVDVDIAAQKIDAPTRNFKQAQNEKQNIEIEIANQEKIINESAVYLSDFEQEEARLAGELHLSKVAQSGEEAIEGKLLILEGWATTDTQEQVENMLDNSGVFYLKDNPTPEDNTPVKLKNGKFARLFEFIGGMYALPKYGTADLTKYCAPFYMFFFGFCLCDGGYGLLFLIAGLLVVNKMKNEQMKRIGWLTFFCGLSTFLFGVLTGSFFGISLSEIAIFEPYKDKFLTSNHLFYFAIAVGIFHILFAMGVKAYNTTKYFGFKYALSTLGWMIVIIAGLCAVLLPSEYNLSFSSPIILSSLGLGLCLMLFCNSPGKNIFVNFGSGLWNTYNDVTGLLSDTLSYLRLFALGLSGATLAMVFNDLAVGMSPDIIVVKQIVMILILGVGHGINLFMSALGAFVHPMRLTFVEFYKNSGFEAGNREFKPLKK